MMNLSCSLAIAFILSTVLQAQDGSPINFGNTHSFGGHVISGGFLGFVRLPEKPKGPRWTADEENPPLSAADAIELAIAKSKKLDARNESLAWILESASLQALDGDKGYWCWEIAFRQADVDFIDARVRKLFVFMDKEIANEQISSDSPINFGATRSCGGNIRVSYAAGYRFVAQLPQQPTGPCWHAGERNPPVSAADAITLAVAKRKELIDDDELFDWRLRSASLLPLDGREGSWCWEITFEQRAEFSWARDLSLFVLMDRTVLKPSILDDSLGQSKQLELIPSKSK